MPFTWTGAGGDANWTTTANWSTSIVPGINDTAHFVGAPTCQSNCSPTINANISVNGIDMQSSYSGTITQGAGFSVTVGSSGWAQSAGTFTGNNGAITISGPYSLTGGTFSAPANTISVSGNYTVTGSPTYTAGTSTLNFSNTGSITITPGTVSYNNVTFPGPNSCNAYDLNAGTMDVYGTLTFATGGWCTGAARPINNGTFRSYGNVALSSSGAAGTSTLIISGNASGQTLSSPSAACVPNLTIAAGGANDVTLSGSIKICGLTYLFTSANSLTTTGSTLTFSGSGATSITPGAFAYNNVTFPNTNACNTFNLNAAAMNVNGTLTIGTSGWCGVISSINNGTLTANGNVVLSSSGAIGTAQVQMESATAATIGGTPGTPGTDFVINKTAVSNTVTATSNINRTVSGQTFTLTTGTVDLAGYNLTVNSTLTVGTNGKLICNGGTVSAGSYSISGEVSCGPVIGITWTGATGDNLWSTAGNWTNNTIPGASDIAIFGAKCSGANCNVTMDTVVNVKGLSMTSVYSGTITQNPGIAITVGTSGWTQAAGTFAGGNSAMTLTSNLTMSGGTFTATSGTIILGTAACGTKKTLDVTGGTFNHNNGRLRSIQGRTVGASCNTDAQLGFPVGFTLYDFEVSANASAGGWVSNLSATSATLLIVENNYYDYGGKVNFNIDVKRDFYANKTNPRGTGYIRMMGTLDQYFHYTDGSQVTNTLKIEKATGTVSAGSGTNLSVWSLELLQGSFTAPTSTLQLGELTGTSISMNSLLVSSGTTFNTNGGTVKFNLGRTVGASAAVTSIISVPVGFSFNHVSVVADANAGGWVSNINSGGVTLNVLGNLSLAGHINAAIWEVAGDISVSANATGGTGTIKATGTGAQNISHSGGTWPGATVTIDKTNGVSTQTTAVSLSVASQNLTINDGIHDMAGFALTVNNVVTVASGARLICNGGVLSAASYVITGEVSCGPQIGITWTGFAGDNLWSTAGNWTNNTIPGANDLVIFNSSCSGANCNATIDSSISVKGITFDSSYTGILTQGAGFSFTVGTNGWTQAGGTFTGGNSALYVTGVFNLTGGTFTSTTGTFTSDGGTADITTFNVGASATFNHNSGTLKFGANANGAASTTRTINLPTTLQVYHLIYSADNIWRNNWNLTTGDTFVVNGDFTMQRSGAFGSAIALGGTVQVLGNLITNAGASGGTTEVLLTGTAAQTYTSTGGELPILRINKTGGSVAAAGGTTNFEVWQFDLVQGSFAAPTGTFTIREPNTNTVFSVASGTTFTHNSGTLRFAAIEAGGSSISRTIDLPTSLQVFNLIYSTDDEWTSTWTLSGTDKFIVNGQFTMNKTSTAGVVNANGGSIELLGNATVSDGANGGTTALKVVGTGPQLITGTAAGLFPTFEINSGGDVVTFAGTLVFKRNYTYTLGVVDTATSTVDFRNSNSYGYSQTIVPGAAINYYNVTFSGDQGTHDLSSGTMTVNGMLTLNDTNNGNYINSGTILAYAGVTAQNIGYMGSALIKMTGTANQTISGVSTAKIPNFEIDKSAGTVTYSGTLMFMGNYNRTLGAIDAGTSTVIFAYYTKTIVPGDTVNYNNVTFTGYQATHTLNGTVLVNGTLLLAPTTSPNAINTGTINAYGNVDVTGTGFTGTAVLNLVGSSASSLSVTSGAGLLSTTLTVNKSGGAIVSLGEDASLNVAGQDVTVTAGTLNLAGYDLTVNDVLTVGASGTLKCSGGEFFNASLVNSGTINCPGYAGYDFNWTGAGGNSNWNTPGNWQIGAVPGSGDIASFSDTFCGANCNATVNVDPNARGLWMVSPYTGTITQSSGIGITLGAKGFRTAAGTFNGGNTDILVNAPLKVTGGTFNATSATTRLGRQRCTDETVFEVGATATFNHNSGTMKFASTGGWMCTPTYTLDVPNGLQFNHVMIDATFFNVNYPGIIAVSSGKSVRVLSDFNHNSGYVGGTWTLDNNLIVGAAANGANSNGKITFNGTGNQTYAVTGSGRTASLTVDKATGTVTPTGGTTSLSLHLFELLQGNFTAPSGTMRAGRQNCTSETVFTVANGTTFTHNSGTVSFSTAGSWLCNPTFSVSVPVALSFNNVVIDGAYYNGSYSSPITGLGGATVSVSGDLSVVSGSMNGAWNVAGNFAKSGGAGTGALTMSGSGTRTINITSGSMPSGIFTVNKSGGVINQLSNVVLAGGAQAMTITAGTYNMAGFNLNVAGLLTNNGALHRGPGTCGTITNGSFAGTAAVCP